jgi:hypothetical protein
MRRVRETPAIRAQESRRNFPTLFHQPIVRIVRAVRRQCQDAGKCSGALTAIITSRAHAKAADSCGQDKGADAKGGADLPELSASLGFCLVGKSARR